MATSPIGRLFPVCDWQGLHEVAFGDEEPDGLWMARAARSLTGTDTRPEAIAQAIERLCDMLDPTQPLDRERNA